jgi:hypothetical protein
LKTDHIFACLDPAANYSFEIEDFVFDNFARLNKSTENAHAMMSNLLECPLVGFLNMVRDAENPVVDCTRYKQESTTESTRPDWLMTLDALVVFRGEEKVDGVANGLLTASEELTSKLLWYPLFFGDLEYALGYALCGTKIQLFAIHPDPSPVRQEAVGGACAVERTKLGVVLDLADFKGRIMLLRYIIQLVRVIQSMASKMPKDAPLLGKGWKRPGSGLSSTITFFEKHVRKMLQNVQGGPQFDFEGLGQLYDLVKRKMVVNTIQCGTPNIRESRSGVVVLHLFPLGLSRLPKNATELKACLTAVNLALKSMHAHGFVHRDVRWPNIVQKVNMSWMLIDLEFAAKVKSQAKQAEWPTWINPDDSRWPERVRGQGWGTKGDVWMLGALVHDVGFAFTDKSNLEADIKECDSCKKVEAVLAKFIPS